MPIYLITNRSTDAQRLVRAANKAAAIRHVAADTLGAQVAAAETLVELLQDGVRVEDAGAEPPTAPRDDSDRDIHDGSER
jgi:hypothetical protein